MYCIFITNVKLIVLLLSCVLFGRISGVQAATTSDVPISVTFLAPPCTVIAPSNVNLGSIYNGIKSYTPFVLQVNCSSSIRTSLYAQALGTLESGTTDTVLMENTNAKFWLTVGSSSTKVTLTGMTGTAICDGSDNRDCVMTPNTLVTPANPRGDTHTIIRFNLRYDT